MQIFKNTIDTHSDFEFHSNEQKKISYSICIPNNRIKSLVVYIAEFGDDAGAYRENFQNHIANDYSMACLVVDYHCFFSRPANGASLSIDNNTMKAKMNSQLISA